MGKQTKHLMDEADIGSGEKTPAEQETDKMIDQLGQTGAGKPQGREPQRDTVKPPKDQGPARKER